MLPDSRPQSEIGEKRPDANARFLMASEVAGNAPAHPASAVGLIHACSTGLPLAARLHAETVSLGRVMYKEVIYDVAYL